MFDLKSIFLRRKEAAVPSLSSTDKQLVALVSKRRRPTTAKELIELTGIKRRNVYTRLSILVEKGLFKNDGRGFSYVGPKTAELRVTPFIAIISGIGVASAYATNNAGVMFFSFLTFVVSYLVER